MECKSSTVVLFDSRSVVCGAKPTKQKLQLTTVARELPSLRPRCRLCSRCVPSSCHSRQPLHRLLPIAAAMSDDMEEEMDETAVGAVKAERGPAIRYGTLEEQARASHISAADSDTTSAGQPSNGGLVINQQTLAAAMHQPQRQPVSASSQSVGSSSTTGATAESEYYELTGQCQS